MCKRLAVVLDAPLTKGLFSQLFGEDDEDDVGGDGEPEKKREQYTADLSEDDSEQVH